MKTETQRQRTLRALIDSAQGRFVSVTYIKKDGTERVAQLQPAVAKFHVKGEDASPQAQQAAATRAANNPHLYNYIDRKAGGFRCFDVDRVTRVAVDGIVLQELQVAE